MAIMYAVIFRAKTRDLDDEYFETARRMRRLAKEYGCVAFTAVTEGEDEIAISYWESLDQITAWKQNEEHRIAQRKGQQKWYADYTVEIVEVEDHPWFVACQFHPEFQSKPIDAHPLFKGLVGASLERKAHRE